MVGLRLVGLRVLMPLRLWERASVSASVLTSFWVCLRVELLVVAWFPGFAPQAPECFAKWPRRLQQPLPLPPATRVPCVVFKRQLCGAGCEALSVCRFNSRFLKG